MELHLDEMNEVPVASPPVSASAETQPGNPHEAGFPIGRMHPDWEPGGTGSGGLRLSPKTNVEARRARTRHGSGRRAHETGANWMHAPASGWRSARS